MGSAFGFERDKTQTKYLLLDWKSPHITSILTNLCYGASRAPLPMKNDYHLIPCGNSCKVSYYGPSAEWHPSFHLKNGIVMGVNPFGMARVDAADAFPKRTSKSHKPHPKWKDYYA